MNKLLTIGLKDLTLALRDRAALILMFAAPLVLTLGLGLVTGRFSGQSDNNGLRDIPVVLVNQDDGRIGAELVNVFTSPDVGTLVKPISDTDPAVASKRVDDDKVAAAVIIPAGYSASIIPAANNASGVPAGDKKIEIYVNPAQPVGAGVIRSIVDEFVARVQAGRVSGLIAITLLIENGLLKPADAAAYGQDFGRRQNGPAQTIITVRRTSDAGTPPPTVDILAVLAPGMALLFLMYTVTRGGATLLAERDNGTLARMLVTPTSATQIIGGKVIGIFLTAVVQVAVLIVGSGLLFNLHWGDPIGVAALVLAVAAGATGWGMVIAAFARTTAMVGSLGAAVMLMFGVLGGSFGDNFPLPDFLLALGKITPNAWGIKGFTGLASGGVLGDVLPNIIALSVMAVVLFTVSVWLFRKNGFIKQ